jgi:hypothetical protein
MTNRLVLSLELQLRADAGLSGDPSRGPTAAFITQLHTQRCALRAQKNHPSIRAL